MPTTFVIFSAQIDHITGDGELGDGRILEHHGVGSAVAGRDRIGQRGGCLLGGAGVVELDLDPGIGLLESIDKLLRGIARAQPQTVMLAFSASPLLALLSALSPLPLPQAASPTSVATAAVAAMTFLVLRMLSPPEPSAGLLRATETNCDIGRGPYRDALL